MKLNIKLIIIIFENEEKNNIIISKLNKKYNNKFKLLLDLKLNVSSFIYFIHFHKMRFILTSL